MFQKTLNNKFHSLVKKIDVSLNNLLQKCFFLNLIVLFETSDNPNCISTLVRKEIKPIHLRFIFHTKSEKCKNYLKSTHILRYSNYICKLLRCTEIKTCES